MPTSLSLNRGSRQSHLSQLKGFTLIELLIVLMIIAALMGLLIPGIMLVRKQAKKAKAREQIAQIEAACSTYRDANGVYPSGFPGAWMVADGATNNPTLQAALASVDEHFRDARSVIDPWLNPIRYRPARVYEFDPAKGKQIDGDEPPKLETYQVWSIGPDGVDQIDDGVLGDGDDIPNWNK